jgi:hypothetical protein
MNRAARTLHAGVRLALAVVGAVFIFTALVKLRDVDAFRSTILAHGVIPESLGSPAAWSVAVVELGAGVLTILLVLLRPGHISAASVVPAALLAAFAAYALVLRVHPPPVPTSCGCGIISAPIEDWGSLARRNGAIALAVALLPLLADRMVAVRLGPPSADETP